MVLPQQDRYICTSCSFGWHYTPYCPSAGAASLGSSLMALSDAKYRTRQIEKKMVEDGLWPAPAVKRFRFRWWWIPLVLTMWIALIILI
ncbi:hypothetical protein [Nocardia noduli]|uniref:hypothetical protein n=1 Tax=Nocardia noduli TaxID=2815722 RepID=UPI001C214862|nr:hypothetical protein [Nocardia noduli]